MSLPTRSTELEIELRTLSSEGKDNEQQQQQNQGAVQVESHIQRLVREFARKHGLSDQTSLRDVNKMRSTYDLKLALMDVTPAIELKLFLTQGCCLSSGHATSLVGSGVTSLDQLCSRTPKAIEFPLDTRSGVVSLASYMASLLMPGKQHGVSQHPSRFFRKILAGEAIDRWRSKLLRRMTIHWQQDNSFRFMILKPKSTALTSE